MATMQDAKKFVNVIKKSMPDAMEYYVPLTNEKDIDKFVKRVEKNIRSSLEYRDYIQFLKEHVDLNECIFLMHLMGKTNNKKKISIEMHHGPFTLYDIVRVVVTKYIDEGLPINDLLIADEVMLLHYENKVGLVPLSKTAHQIIHRSTKLFVPLHMYYGNYSQFIEEYEPYITDEMYEKLEKAIDMTKNLTPESFNAILKEFKYLEISGVEDISKLEVTDSKIA